MSEHPALGASVMFALVGVVGLWRLLWGYPRAGRFGAIAAYRVLGAREAALAAAAADAFFPAGGAIACSGGDAGCVAWLDGYLARCRTPQRRLVLLLLWFSEYGPLLFGPTRKRFSRLTPDERHMFLACSEASPLYLRRIVTLTLRGLMTMGYFANPAVLSQIGLQEDLDPFGLGDPATARDEVPPPKVSGERLKVDLSRAAIPADDRDVG